LYYVLIILHFIFYFYKFVNISKSFIFTLLTLWFTINLTIAELVWLLEEIASKETEIESEREIQSNREEERDSEENRDENDVNSDGEIDSESECEQSEDETFRNVNSFTSHHIRSPITSLCSHSVIGFTMI
jgi:predicted membrane protein